MTIEPRRNSRGVCTGCGDLCSGYDTQFCRRYEYIPLWGIAVYFLYCPRRLNCPECGVHVEQVPWAVGKHRLTQRYAWFLSRWARRLSWKETAEAFGTTEHMMPASMKRLCNLLPTHPFGPSRQIPPISRGQPVYPLPTGQTQHEHRTAGN